MLLKIKSFSSTSVSVYRINKNRSSTAKSNFNFKTEFQLTLQTDHFVKKCIRIREFFWSLFGLNKEVNLCILYMWGSADKKNYLIEALSLQWTCISKKNFCINISAWFQNHALTSKLRLDSESKLLFGIKALGWSIIFLLIVFPDCDINTRSWKRKKFDFVIEVLF